MPVSWEDWERYKKLGFSIFPIAPRTKIPLFEWRPYQTHPPSDDEVADWLLRYPAMNVAVATGAVSHIIVIDVDDESIADKNFTAKIPSTATVKTAKGRHYYLRHPGVQVKNAVRLAPGIDIRGDGGYVLAPPSIHPGDADRDIPPGLEYVWEIPPERGIADLPPELLEAVRADRKKPNGEVRVSEQEWAKILRGVTKGQRNSQATRIFGHYFAKGLHPDEVWAIGLAWNSHNSPPMDEGELRTTYESIREREAQKGVALEDFTSDKGADDYTFTWHAYDVKIRISYLRETREGPMGEIEIEAPPKGQVHWGRLVLSSTSQRETLIRNLDKVTQDIPWDHIINRLCQEVSIDFRKGDPIQILKPSTTKSVRDLVENFLPWGETTVLYGDGGSFKSSMALTVAVAIAAGIPLPWGGFRPTETAKTLYLDWESSPEEHEDRLAMILKGLGLKHEDVDGKIFYRLMTRPLSEDTAFLRSQIVQLGISFVIVDSYGPAAGVEVEKADAATRTMNALRSFKDTTRLVISHVSKADLEKKGTRPYGSVYTWNLARSVWELKKSDDERRWVEVTLQHRKNNRGPVHLKPIFIKIQHANDEMIFEWLERPGAGATDLKRSRKMSEWLVETLRAHHKALPLSVLVELAAEDFGDDENLAAKVKAALQKNKGVFQEIPQRENEEQSWGLGVRAGRTAPIEPTEEEIFTNLEDGQ